MGFTPQQVNAMSLWQWFAALNGYIEANSSKGGAKISDSEAEELFAWIDGGETGRRTLRTQTYWLDGERLVAGDVVTFEVG